MGDHPDQEEAMRAEPLAKYGHHPDPEIDADVEVERLRGQLAEAHAGLVRALDFRAATPNALAIKRDVRYWLGQHGVTPLGHREMC